MMKRQVKVDQDDSHYLSLIEDIAFGNNDDDLLNLESCSFDLTEDLREPKNCQNVSGFPDHQKSEKASTADEFSSHLVYRPDEVNLQISAMSFSCIKERAETSGVAEVNNEKHQDSFDVDGRNNPRGDKLLHAVIRLQSLWRSYSCSSKFVKTVVDVLIIQSFIRRWLVYQKVKRLKASDTRDFYCYSDRMVITARHNAAKLIQKVWRGRKAQLAFIYDLVNIIISQVRA